MKKVQLYSGTENGHAGIGLQVNCRTATLEDLLQEWQVLCDDPWIYKQHAIDHYGACKACENNCCNSAYVIPDLIAFKQMALQLGLSYEDLIARYFHREKVKVGLLRMKPNPCIFLQDNMCTIYPTRSLLCRLYVCCSLLGATESLIYGMAWAGAAATQKFAREKGLLPPYCEKGLTSFDRLFFHLMKEHDCRDQTAYFMVADHYGAIPLAPFLGVAF